MKFVGCCLWCVWFCLLCYGIADVMNFIFGPFGFGGALDALLTH